MNRYVLLGAIAVLGQSHAARGAIITPISQTRTSWVDATGTDVGPLGGQTLSSPDFGPFDGVASYSSGPTADGSITLDASQHSRINSDSITSNGDLTTTFGSNGFGGQFNRVTLVDVTFTIDSTSPYSMAVFLTSGFLPEDGRLQVFLYPAGSSTYLSFAIYQNGSSSGSHTSGQLAAGNYHLVANVDDYGIRSHGNFTYNWYFAVPSPCSAAAFGCLGLLATRRKRA